MAPLPSNNTARLYLDYTSGGPGAQNHTLLVRFDAVATNQAGAQFAAFTFLEAIGEASFAAGWRVLQTRLSAPGQDISVPVAAYGPLLEFEGSASVGGWSNVDQTVEWRFVGRDPLEGRRAFFSLYGLAVSRPQTFREEGVFGETPNWVGRGLTVLNDGEEHEGVFVAVSNIRALWYGYANWQHNSYWEGELRS